MNAYILTNAEPVRTFQGKNGLQQSQTIILRRIDTEHEMTDRYAVENYSGIDVSHLIGSPVMCEIHGRVNEKDGRHYTTLFTREVVASQP